MATNDQHAKEEAALRAEFEEALASFSAHLEPAEAEQVRHDGRLMVEGWIASARLLGQPLAEFVRAAAARSLEGGSGDVGGTPLL